MEQVMNHYLSPKVFSSASTVPQYFTYTSQTIAKDTKIIQFPLQFSANSTTQEKEAATLRLNIPWERTLLEAIS